MRTLLRALSNLLRVSLWPIYFVARRAARPKSPWLVLRLSPRLTEFQSREPLWRRVLGRGRLERPTSLEDLRDLGRAIARDEAIAGLLLYVPPLEAGFAACESVRKVVLDLRGAGKQVVCYLPQGGGNRELYVALAADRILLAPLTAISPLGLGSHAIYLKRLLDRLGIVVEAYACGEYKSAAEPLLRESMSEPAREQMEAVLASLHEPLHEALRQRLGASEERVAEVLRRGLISASVARELGVVDEVAYEDELAGRLLGPGKHPGFAQGTRYLAYHRARVWQPVRVEPHIAIIPVRGTIVGDGVALGRTTAQLGAIVATIREVARDPKAKAVVLYVNSPGGSALASELIHREVERLAAKKPVVACFGDVAASGGYYIAAPCRRIVAQPATVTGSIGVISAKIALDGLLAKLGLHAEALRTSPHADMYSATRRLEPAERAMIEAHARELYARFLEVVATGRGKDVQEIELLARGRVWSGRDAHARGLVDRLGGLDRAVEEARSLLPALPAPLLARLRGRVRLPRKQQGPPPAPLDLQTWLELVPVASEASWVLAALASKEPALFYAPLATRLY